ncbi:MAG: amidohydrolase family protein [Gammaproteobacteria bacterium]|nr:amidohydrolase family protein [Gammaproteobacteria bacterium]
MSEPNSYAAGRKMYDSDSHVMETLTWLTDHAKPEQAGLIKPLATEKGGAGVRKAIEKAAARRADPQATQELLQEPLISGPKGWAAYGASSPEERSHALDLLGFEKQLVFPTFAMGQFAFSSNPDKLYGGTDMLNRAMGSFCGHDPRLLAVGFAPLNDPALALEAVQGGLKQGIKAFWLKSDPAGGRSPSHLDYDPIWDLLQRERVPIVLHIGGGRGLDKDYHETGHPPVIRLAGRRREPAGQGLPRDLPFTAELPHGADLRSGVSALPGASLRRHRTRRHLGTRLPADSRSGASGFPQSRAAAAEPGTDAFRVFPPPGSGQPVSL